MGRLLIPLSLALVAQVVVPTQPRAQTGVGEVIAVAEFINWAFNEGKKWQASQPWGKYKAWKPSVPLYVKNFTNKTVNFSTETENCEPTTHSFGPGEGDIISCQSGDGDKWHNVYYGSTSFSVSGPSAIGFTANSDNTVELEIFDISKMVDVPQTPSLSNRSGRQARGGLSPSMQPCPNPGPYRGAPRVGSPVGCP
jgi:hypothetical protein